MFFAHLGRRRNRRFSRRTNSDRDQRQRGTFIARLERLEPRILLHGDHVSTDAPDLSPEPATLTVVSQEAVVAAVSPSALLPDLTPWASASQGFIYDWTVQGNELRLTTAMANLGTGRMELRGGATNGTTQDVYQRIYEPDGTFTDVLAGTFTYHSSHGHIHFDDFAEYRLREVLPDGGVGAILATGEKISFCLLDVQRYNTTGPGSPYFLTCGQVQGISVGWADVYDRGLPGQSIDITGIGPGTYWLEVEVDPDNHLMESNENNNITRIQITLGGGGGSGDAFEPNDSFATASTLAPPEDHTYNDLSIHASGNADYYRVTASATGTMTVRLTFQHSLGDVDLYVYNASQTQLSRSISVTNNEQVSFSVIAGQYYYIRVIGYNGATNPNYSMFIDQPEAGGGGGGGGSAEGVYYFSTTAGGTLSSTNGSPSVSFTDADIVQLTVLSNGQRQYQMYFDGSDVGLTTANEDIDAFAFLPDGSILISTVGSFSVPAPGGGTITGGGHDLLRFVPTSLGPTTAGQWSMNFDGSDVGLTASAENVDAVAALSDGRLLISTTGAFSVPGVSGQDEDLLVFTPTSLGGTTTGSWALYFDGSDVGLATNANEDVNALFVRETGGSPTLYFSTLGNFSVTGASGANEDVFAFNPTSLGSTTAGSFGPGLAFDGSLYGLASFNVDGFYLGDLPSPLQTASFNSVRAVALTLASSVTAGGTGQVNSNVVAYAGIQGSSASATSSQAARTNVNQQSLAESSPSPHSQCSCQQQTGVSGVADPLSAELVDEWLASLVGGVA